MNIHNTEQKTLEKVLNGDWLIFRKQDNYCNKETIAIIH